MDSDPPRGQYDFIVNPDTGMPMQKPTGLRSVAQNSFFKLLAIIIGGAVLLIVAAVIITNVFFADKTNVNDLVSLAQYQAEILRLTGTKDIPATTQGVKNASITTELTVSTQSQEVLKFLGLHGRKVPVAELNLKTDPAVDQQLKIAQETSTFDSTFAKLLREELATYSQAIITAHDNALSNTEKAMLSKHYDQTQLLIKQWPQ